MTLAKLTLGAISLFFCASAVATFATPFPEGCVLWLTSGVPNDEMADCYGDCAGYQNPNAACKLIVVPDGILDTLYFCMCGGELANKDCSATLRVSVVFGASWNCYAEHPRCFQDCDKVTMAEYITAPACLCP